MRSPIAALLLTTFLAGCGIAEPIHSVAPAAVQATASDPQTKDEFVKAVAALGVKLTPDQVATIEEDRMVSPNGQWAPRPAENLTAAQNLTIHFQKHCRDFNPPVASEANYQAQAIALAKGERGTIKFLFDITSFDKGYQSNVVRWNPQSCEMTAVRLDGAMTTYYLNYRMSPKRFVSVPAF